MTPDNITFGSWSVAWVSFMFLFTGAFVFDNWQLSLIFALLSYIVVGAKIATKITFGRWYKFNKVCF